MSGRLKTVYDEIINTDLVSAKDFSRLYEAHAKALDKIETMEAQINEQQKNIEQLIIDNVELTEQNKQMKQALSDWQIHLEGN